MGEAEDVSFSLALIQHVSIHLRLSKRVLSQSFARLYILSWFNRDNKFWRADTSMSLDMEEYQSNFLQSPQFRDHIVVQPMLIEEYIVPISITIARRFMIKNKIGKG
jgi:hypothetical protein